MAKNEFEFEILEDGTISIDTSDFDETKHLQADEIMEELKEIIGGEVVIRHKPDVKKAHVHRSNVAHAGRR